MVSVSDKKAKISNTSRPPSCPNDRSKHAKQEYCSQYAKWLLLSSTPAFPSPKCSSIDDLSAAVIRTKRQRDIEGGAEFWINAALEKALDGISNYSEAIRLLLSKAEPCIEDLNAGETTHLCILKYPVPEHLIYDHESDASVLIVFAAGMHKLLYPVFHPPGKTRRQPLPIPFSLQALQDKFTGCKRKVPIAVLAHFGLFYTRRGWFKRVDDLTKISSNTTFEAIIDLPPELNITDLVEIAQSL